ncbi:putative beta-galactosidase [Streptomyces viridochromogenes Tue57]|uniref:Putative beta-galactosidase n=1 Tax=Streptomyces viridochromogenes Tue57 TaxID=1160705 RepID=L8PAZ4_STRVR|nr:putative beta-galactosidase [Streptomyces viridochromogenes Tue57]
MGWAGANRSGGALHDGPLEPDVTSYDYDAPIDEHGRATEKFWAFREVLAEYSDGPLPGLPPAPAPLGAPAEVALTGWAPLGDVLEARCGREVSGPVPPTFEELDVDRGLVRYAVTVPGPRQPYPLTVRGLRDLAVVYVDGERAGVLTEDDACLKEPVAGYARVELWVESLGRVNYGPRLGEPKGITGGVLHERQYLHDVRARGLRLEALDDAERVRAVPSRALPEDGAAGLYRGTVTVRGAGDARLELPGRTRGFVWVNGFNLGRYWSAGPQSSLYVPGPVLREGGNEIWVLELAETARPGSGEAGAPVLRAV